MKKRNYKFIQAIKSLDELYAQTYVYDVRVKKLYHIGWIASWGLRYCYILLHDKVLWKVSFDVQEVMPNETDQKL